MSTVPGTALVPQREPVQSAVTQRQHAAILAGLEAFALLRQHGRWIMVMGGPRTVEGEAKANGEPLSADEARELSDYLRDRRLVAVP